MQVWTFRNDWLAVESVLTAYHLIELPAVALRVAELPWVVGSLFRARFEASHWWLKLVVLVLVTALPLAFSLWYVWPEQSLY